jgi:hypothetical protein
MVFFDPGGVSPVNACSTTTTTNPHLHLAASWRKPGRMIAIKRAPGLDYADLPFQAPYAIECVSLNGELRETVVWLDAPWSWRYRATLLTDTQVWQHR